MKILHVCPRYYPYVGGVEVHVRNICERLSRTHDVQILTTDPSGSLPKQEVINHVKITRFPSWAPNEAYFFSSKLKRYLKENSASFDLVHAHNYGAFPALYAAQAKTKNKLFFTPHYHGTGHTLLRSLFHKPYKLWGRKIFEKANRVICVSRFEMELIVKNFGNFEGKLVLVPNGLNLDDFHKLEREKKETKTVLTVGRLERYKGIQYLIQVLPRLSKDTVLEVVGKGPYKNALVEIANKMGVLNRVSFYEDLPRDELLQKYVDADVFALLSKHEAYGMTVAEALSSGTPCMVANTSALTEWVDDQNCYGIDYPIDQNQLKNLIEELVGHRVSKIPTILDWEKVTEKILNVYTQ